MTEVLSKHLPKVTGLCWSLGLRTQGINDDHVRGQGGREVRDTGGIHAYTWLNHFIVQQKLNIVEQLYFN